MNTQSQSTYEPAVRIARTLAQNLASVEDVIREFGQSPARDLGALAEQIAGMDRHYPGFSQQIYNKALADRISHAEYGDFLNAGETGGTGWDRVKDTLADVWEQVKEAAQKTAQQASPEQAPADSTQPAPAPSGTGGSAETGKFMGLPNPWGYILLAVLILLLLAGLWFLLKPKKKKT